MSDNKLKTFREFSTTPRVCLRCGNSFPSKGVGNRICPPCHRINQGQSHVPGVTAQTHRKTKVRND